MNLHSNYFIAIFQTDSVRLNIYLNDLVFLPEYTDVCIFADDTTFHACDKDLNSLINRLEHNNLLAIEWFENNYMKINQDKCHLIVSDISMKMNLPLLVSQ